MGTDAYSEQLPTRRMPAFGDPGPPPAAQPKEDHGLLGRKSETALAIAIVVPAASIYAALSYAAYLTANALL
jgi:hypothetical protein